MSNDNYLVFMATEERAREVCTILEAKGIKTITVPCGGPNSRGIQRYDVSVRYTKDWGTANDILAHEIYCGDHSILS